MNQSSRSVIPYALAASIAFMGSAVVLKGTVLPPGSPGETAGPGMLSYVVAVLLILTGMVLVTLALTTLFHARAARRLGR
jgi:hypothetical protein